MAFNPCSGVKKIFILIFALKKCNWSLLQTKSNNKRLSQYFSSLWGIRNELKAVNQKGHVNYFLRPPGCQIFPTRSRRLRGFFYQRVIEVEYSFAA